MKTYTKGKIFIDREVNEITGVPIPSLKKLRSGTYKESKYSPYLVNFEPTADRKKWVKVGNKKCETVPGSENKFRDAKVGQITGLGEKTVREIRLGQREAGIDAKYLVNFTPENGYWIKTGNARITPKNKFFISDDKLSKITGIPETTLCAIRTGKRKLENCLCADALANYSCINKKWIQTDNKPVARYQKRSEYPGRITEEEISEKTGVPFQVISAIKLGKTKDSKYLPYLANYSCESGYWQQVDDEAIAPYTPEEPIPGKLTDADVARATGVGKDTVRCIRKKIYKTSKFTPFLKNYSCEKGYWMKVSDLPIEPYVPDSNPNKLTETEVSKKTGIETWILKTIRTGGMPSKNADYYFKKLKNYSWSKGYWEKISDEPEPPVDFDLDNSVSLYDLYQKYSDSQPEYIGKQLRSVLVRYFVPYVGGEKPAGKRASSEEIEIALSFLEKIPALNAPNIQRVVHDAIEEMDIGGSNAYSIRNAVKSFVEDPMVKSIYKNLDSYNRLDEWRKCSPSANPKRKTKALHGVPKKKPFRLTAKNPKGEQIYPEDYINDRLKQQIEDIKAYFEGKHSEESVRKIGEKILEFCGWLVRYKSVSYESLCLESMIQYNPLNVDVTDFVDIQAIGLSYENKQWKEYIFRKAMVKELAYATARKNIALIEEYCNFVGNKASTGLVFLNVAYNVAVYLYRNDVSIHSEEFTEPRDLPIVKKISLLRQKLNQISDLEEPSVPHEDKSEPWPVIIDVFNRVRRLSEIDRMARHQRRDDTAKVKALQKFLMLGFLVVLPPDRSRSLWDMRIGKNLIKGVFDGTYFEEENEENKEKCQWYRYYGSKDYKTGKVYGEHIYPIPNVEFPDGKHFYDYIDLWINWGRNLNKECDHDYFFRTFDHYKRIYKNIVYDRITVLFTGYGFKPVSPHTIRNSYITWLRNQEGVTEEIRASIALIQHHSVEQQAEYDKSSNYQRSLPGYKFHTQSLKKMFWEMKTDGSEH